MGLLILVGALSIYYSRFEPRELCIAIAATFATLGTLVSFVLRFRQAIVLWGVLIAGLTTWYATDRPSGEGEWATEYAVPATVTQIGRTVSLQHVRNFAYHSESSFSPGYYDAAFPLDDLDSLDLITSYWAGEAIAHVFVSFGFHDGRHLAFSIETRRRPFDIYSTVAGFFHHYELFYVVADERDVIGLRTDIRHERVYLYRVHLTPAAREQLFLSYLEKVEALSRRPEWYNTLTDNCTTGILGRARAGALEAAAYNWRVLLSGYAAQYAYRLGILNDDMPFEELKRRSRIIRPAGATIEGDFSAVIRKDLPN